LQTKEKKLWEWAKIWIDFFNRGHFNGQICNLQSFNSSIISGNFHKNRASLLFNDFQ